MKSRAVQFLMVLTTGVVLGALGFLILRSTDQGTESVDTTASPPETDTTDETVLPETTTSQPVTTTVPPTTTTTVLTRDPNTVPGWTVGMPWGATVGMTMFRGNPKRTFYGMGPVPDTPTVMWRYPDGPMCSSSSEGGESRVWCGMGWTGQPVVWVRDDGVTEVIFGAYDRAVHFVDADTGEDLRTPFPTGDIIKGSVTLDPDQFPLLYFGSRDNNFRILALDRDQPTALWSMNANEVKGIWNNDWDSNPVVVDDILYEGGENGWFYAVELNRGFDGDGLVSVDPQILVAMPGYNDELISKSGRNVSIETSVVLHDQRVYFANSGGRVVGVDVSNVRDGEAPIVFDYYAGGDIDATMVTDAEGMIYVAIEHEPSQMKAVERTRNSEVGQLIKLDPYADGDPRVWGIDLTSGDADSGSWSTPALHEGVLYVNTQQGALLAVDAETGEILWSDEVGWHAWSSPVVVDETLVTATCLGDVRAYSLADPRVPAKLWQVSLGESCLEATPVIWDGRIYLGSRDGFFRALD